MTPCAIQVNHNVLYLDWIPAYAGITVFLMFLLTFEPLLISRLDCLLFSLVVLPKKFLH